MIKELTHSRFTPSLLTHEALEAIFVRREDLAQRLVSIIRESATTGNKHFVLLHGPRGIGKTHLVSLLHGRIMEDKELAEKLYVAWLREEEWGVASYIDFLRAILRALHERYEDIELEKSNERLTQLNVEDAELKAEELLIQFVGPRTLLVFSENFDEIFEGLEEIGQQQLRAFIQNHPIFTVIATARGLFAGVDQRESPFYGFFEITPMDEISADDATQLLRKIAQQENELELAELLGQRQGCARVRALHYLAGGNPRVYVIFSQFITRESLDSLVAAVMSTLDDLTSYYQERMARLTPQQRKIVQFLCDQQGAPTVKDIARSNFISQQSASSQLGKLRDLGYVRSEQRGRESYYELKEPLMRISLGVKKHRGEPLGLLVDFLRLWYTRDELGHKLESLEPEMVMERDYIAHAMRIMEEREEDPIVAMCLRDYEQHVDAEQFEAALRVTEDLIEIRNYPSDWMKRTECLWDLGREHEAVESKRRTLEFKPQSASQWNDLGGVFYALGQHNSALDAFECALELNPHNARAWNDRGITLRELGKHQEAITAFDKSLEIDASLAPTWVNKAICQSDLGQPEEALLSLDTAIGLSPELGSAWCARGTILGRLGNQDEALSALDKAIELGFSDKYVWNNRGAVLWLSSRREEALVSYRRALEIDSDDAEAWDNFGRALATLARHEEALVAYDEALKLTPNNATIWINRSTALGRLGRYEECLAASDRALEIRPEDVGAYNNRGGALHRLGRHREALTAFERAIQINPNFASLWRNRGITLCELGELENALSAFERYTELAPEKADSWNFLAASLSSLGRLEDAMAAFDKSFQVEPNKKDFSAQAIRAETLMLLGRWEEGKKELDSAIKEVRSTNKSKSQVEHSLASNILMLKQDSATWYKHIGVWLELFDKHGALVTLGEELVRSIRVLKVSRLDHQAMRAWYEVWEKLASSLKEMELPLRLLRTAVKYFHVNDDRVLFDLPLEERNLIRPLLDIT